VLTTTLRDILKYNPCGREPGSNIGWDKLLNHIGVNYGWDNCLPLTMILESNGISDCLWAFRSLNKKDLDRAKMIAVKFAVFCPERVLPIFEDKYPQNKSPREAIEFAKKWIKKGFKKNINAAAYTAVAYTAAYAAYAAYAAAAYAAYAFAVDAATYAVAYATTDATDVAAAADDATDVAAAADAAATDAAAAAAAAADDAAAKKNEVKIQTQKLKQLLEG